MTTDQTSTATRRGARAAVTLLGLLPVLLAGPALAAPPETWEDTQREAPLRDVLYLVGVPIAIFVLITLLVFLPSMVRRQRGESAEAFGDPEWFGGPRKGLEAAGAPQSGAPQSGTSQSGAHGSGAHAAGADDERGGAGARW